jgi:hypothetical protein
LYHTSAASTAVHEDVIAPPSFVAPLNVCPVRLFTPAVQVEAVPRLIAFAQLSLAGCAKTILANKIQAITKRVDGFFMKLDLVQQNMK